MTINEGEGEFRLPPTPMPEGRGVAVVGSVDEDGISDDVLLGNSVGSLRHVGVGGSGIMTLASEPFLSGPSEDRDSMGLWLVGYEQPPGVRPKLPEMPSSVVGDRGADLMFAGPLPVYQDLYWGCRQVLEFISGPSRGELDLAVVEFSNGLDGKRPASHVLFMAALMAAEAKKKTIQPEVSVDIDGALSLDLRLESGALILAELDADGCLDASVYDQDGNLEKRMPRTNETELLEFF